MRITFVMPGLNMRGGTRVVSIYADRLQQRGHEVKVISVRRTFSWQQHLRSLARGKGLRRPNPPQPSYFDNLNIPVQIVNGYKLNPEEIPDADVVVATWWETAPSIAKLPPPKGAKAYFVQDYGAPGQEIEKIVPTWRLPLHQITISVWLQTLIQQHVPEAQVSLVPNSVDLEFFTSPPRGKQPTPMLGIAYSHVPTKGMALAWQAFQLALKQCPDLRMTSFAYRMPGEDLPAQVNHILQPSDEEMRNIYASCDAWLFPSQIEGFGLPILEAMACRTPVIGTPAGAAPELLNEGCGFLVQHNDPEGMAEAILKICAMSDEEWRQMSDRAYTKVSSYTWEDATDLFEAALMQAIDRQK